MSEVWDVEKIKEILPHRYPFLLIDRVLEIHRPSDETSSVGQRIIAKKNVTIGEAHFTGHFPNRPVMPGVLILEAMAQAGALAFYRPSIHGYDIAITAVHNARFRRPVVPGDSLILNVLVKKYRSQMVFLECVASVDDQKVAEAEIMAHFSVAP